MLGNLKILTTVNASGVKKGFNSIGKSLKKISKQVSLTNAMMAGGIAWDGLKTAAGFAWEFVDAGAALNETLGKTGVVLGDSASKVIDEADAMASKYGVVKQEYLDSATAFAGVFKGLGSSQAEAAEMGNSLAKLGMDLASFNNSTNEEAFGAIGAALRGEMDTIERFGIYLSADKVAAEAMALGLAKSTSQISEAAKKQATVSLIFKQSADAQGDLARTYDSTSNQIKAAQGRVANFKADVGSAFSSISGQLSAGLNVALGELANQWSANSEGIKAWAASSVQEGGIVSNMIEWVGIGVGILADTWVSLKLAFLTVQMGVTAGLAGIVKAVDLLGKALEAVINLIPGMNVSFTATTEAMASDLWKLTKDQYANIQKELDKPLPSTKVRKFFADIKKGAAEAAAAKEEAVKSTPQIGTAAATNSGPNKNLSNAFERGSREAREIELKARTGVGRDPQKQIAEQGKTQIGLLASVKGALESLPGKLAKAIEPVEL